MDTLKTVNGTYGSGHTPCQVFVLEDRRGSWYCAESSQNVNFTPETIEDGVDIETLSDTDCFNWSAPIESENELENAVFA